MVVTKRKGRPGYMSDTRDASDRRVQKMFRLRRDADRWDAEQVRLRETGFTQPKGVSFEDYAKAWLYRQRAVVRPSTADFYDARLRLYLLPRLGHMPINKIQREAVLQVQADLAASGGISTGTVNQAILTLKIVLKDAALNGYIIANPAESVRPLAVEKGEMDFLRGHEIPLLLDNARPGERTLFLCGILSGLRIGELLALGWECVDFANGLILVRRTYSSGRIGPPKTKASKRDVDMAPVLADALRKLPSRFAGDLVFPSKAGTPKQISHVTQRELKPALRRAGLRVMSPHALRHTYAALQVEAGAHPKYIQKQMGHASIKTTLDTYGHLMESVGRTATRQLQDVFLSKYGDNVVTSGGRVKGAQEGSG